MTEETLITKYLGVPYKLGGRDLKGLDCWGFIVMVFKDFGYDILDLDVSVDNSWTFKNNNEYIKQYWKKWEQVKEPKFGDGMLLSIKGGMINHAGIYLSSGRFMHCVETGVIVSRVSRWKDNLCGYYRLKK